MNWTRKLLDPQRPQPDDGQTDTPIAPDKLADWRAFVRPVFDKRGRKLTFGEAEKLFNCLTDKPMWGLNGEGMSFFANLDWLMPQVKPYLKSGDTDGWLKYAEDYRAKKGYTPLDQALRRNIE